jgi:hypothetical protein
MVALAAVAPHSTSPAITGPLTRVRGRLVADRSSAAHTRRFRAAEGSSGWTCCKSDVA